MPDIPKNFQQFRAAGVDLEMAVGYGAILIGPPEDRYMWIDPKDYQKCADPAIRRNLDLQRRLCKGCGE